MKEILHKTFFASTYKAIRRASVTGKFDTSIISLFGIISYYLENEDLVKEFKPNSYKTILEKLLELKESMLWQYQDELCTYKEYGTSIDRVEINTPPKVDNNYIVNEEEYTFTLGDFLLNYRDEQNDSWNKLIIYPLTPIDSYGNYSGLLEFEGVEITEPTEIDILGVSKYSTMDLIFYRGNLHQDTVTEQRIVFQVNDNNANPLYSDPAYITIRTERIANLPPSIGDIDLTVDNNVTTVLDYDIFVTQMNPSYSDPEGDELDAIRIESIPGTNEGRFVYLNADIQVGDVISANDLRNGELVHIGPTTASISTDYFEFAARDVGSLIWVR